MKFFQLSFIVLLVVSLGGCLSSVGNGRGETQTVAFEPLDQSLDDVRTISLYGGFVAGLSAVDRVAECGRLSRGEAGDTSSVEIQIRTAMAMMLAPECGGPQKAVWILESVRERVFQTELKNLVAYELALADHMAKQAEKRQVLEKKIAALGTDAAVLKKELKIKDQELQQLKATLNALKEIEKTFHQRDESGTP
jgi:hypothetical protein